MTAAFVSIVMNVHNGRQFIEQSCGSVIAQTFTNWELIIFDNASSDDCTSLVAGNDERIKIHRCNIKRSLAAARNEAVKLATGNYVAFIDVDDIWLPEKLSIQVEFLNNNDNVSLLFTNAIHVDEQCRPFRQHFKKNRVDTSLPLTLGFLLKNNVICMSSVLVERQTLIKHLPFDERLDIFLDFDLFRRLSFQDRCYCINDHLCLYGCTVGR